MGGLFTGMQKAFTGQIAFLPVEDSIDSFCHCPNLPADNNNHSSVSLRTQSTFATTAMDKLISLVCSHTGIDEPTAKKALGALLRFLKDQAAKTDFDFDDKILAQLDGSEALMADKTAKEAVEKAEAGESSPVVGGGGLAGTAFSLVWSLLKTFGILTMLKQLLQPIFGDSAVKLIEGVEEGAEVATLFNTLGIDRSQGLTIVQTVLDFLKDKLDPDTIDSLVEQIPALKLFLSEGKKEE
jgi:hypothetical protein